MKHEWIVEADKTVHLEALHQWPAYSGLLEGLPTERMNKEILKRLPQEAQRHCGNVAVHLIEPAQKPISYEGTYPFGTPMALPSIICVADFTCFRPVDPKRAGSRLVVAWFQDEYAFPVDESILNRFRDIPWSKLAEDFDY